MEIDLYKTDRPEGEDPAVRFSSRLILAFTEKRKSHNKDNSDKVSLKQLKEVYRNGVGDCSSEDPNLLGIARINMFLRMKSKNEIKSENLKKEKKELKGLVFEDPTLDSSGKQVDVSDSWMPNEIDFIQAKKDIADFDLNYNLQDINDIYLDDYESISWVW